MSADNTADSPLDAVPEFDEATRPSAPPVPDVTPAQRARGRRLAAFHRLHLGELAQVQAKIDAVAAGADEASGLAVTVGSLRMTQNLRAVGTLCGRACVMLTAHHDIEEAHIFPALRRGSPGLRCLVDRLAEEHRTVHVLLDRLEREAQALAAGSDPSVFAALRATMERLDRTLRSHFGYEETELADALGAMVIAI